MIDKWSKTNVEYASGSIDHTTMKSYLIMFLIDQKISLARPVRSNQTYHMAYFVVSAKFRIVPIT